MCSVRAERVSRCVGVGKGARVVGRGEAWMFRMWIVLWWGGRRLVWVSMIAVVEGVGRRRVVVEWRGEVSVWRSVSTSDLFGSWDLSDEAAKLCGNVGRSNEKGRPAAERILCRVSRRCRKEESWDWW